MKHVIYVFSDSGAPGACKIGKDENWPSRYKQARCHSPRGIVVSAAFGFADKDAVRSAERAVKALLGLHKRSGDVNEWFDLSSMAAIERLTEAGIVDRHAALAPGAPPLAASARLYDDWREQSAATARFRWHLWLFREESLSRRLKLSYGALYDTAFNYAFTYNPWPVRLIGGFEHQDAVAEEHEANRSVNAQIRSAWESVQREMGSLAAEEVGWLKPEAQSHRVSEHLARYRMRPFALDRAKPSGVRARDASVTPVAIGTVPSQTRVAACPEIYGSSRAAAAARASFDPAPAKEGFFRRLLGS